MDCFLCHKSNEKNELVESTRIVYEDGTDEALKDILNRISATTLSIPSSSFCCEDCVLEIHTYGTLEKRLEASKSLISIKLNNVQNEKADNNFFVEGGKRKRSKPNRFVVKEEDGNDNEEIHTCARATCQMSFKTKVRLATHEKRCCFGGEQRHTCQKCHKTFSSLRNLNDHLKVLHNDPEAMMMGGKRSFQYKCQIPNCGKEFYKKSNYDSHKITHNSSQAPKPFYCDQQGCNIRFKRLRSLKFHLEMKHGPTRKSFLCSICGQTFFSISGYKQHLAKHNGITYIPRRYTCSHCSKAFRSQSDLSIHAVVHTKVKSFNCDICQAQFTQKASLKDHQNVHMKKFQCSTCNKAFGRQRYLDSHLKSCGHGQTSNKKKEGFVSTSASSATLVIDINDGSQPSSAAFQEVAFMIASTDANQNAIPVQGMNENSDQPQTIAICHQV